VFFSSLLEATRDSLPTQGLFPGGDGGVVLFFSLHSFHPDFALIPRNPNRSIGRVENGAVQRQAKIREAVHHLFCPARRVVSQRVEFVVALVKDAVNDHMAGWRDNRFAKPGFDFCLGGARQIVPDNLRGIVVAGGILSEIPLHESKIVEYFSRIPKIQIRKNMVIVICPAWVAMDKMCHGTPSW